MTPPEAPSAPPPRGGAASGPAKPDPRRPLGSAACVPANQPLAGSAPGGPTERIVVLGIGNVLWADEGFGVRCVEALQARYGFAPHVELVDGGLLAVGGELAGVIDGEGLLADLDLTGEHGLAEERGADEGAGGEQVAELVAHQRFLGGEEA